MKKIVLYILKYLVGFGIAALLIWWSVHKLTPKDISDIKAALLRARFWLLIPVAIVLLLSHWFRALRWKQLIMPMGHAPSTVRLLCGLLIGYIGNQLVPRAGEILRCTSIAQTEKIPAEKLIGTMVAERAFDMLCLALITLGTVIMEYQYMQSYVTEIYTTLRTNLLTGGAKRWWLLLIAVALITGLVILYKRSSNHKAGKFIRSVMKGLLEGLSSIRIVQNKPLFILNPVLIWRCYGLSTWLGCFALEETGRLPLSTAVTMLVFGTFGIIVAPGGLGAYPIAIQKTLGFYGIGENIGLASGWILWLAQFIFTMISGTIAWFVIQSLNKSVGEKRSTHPA